MSTTAPTADLPATDHLSTDAKRQLFLRIARELMDASGAVSVADAAGEVVVYAVPADARARAERAIREMTPERRGTPAPGRDTRQFGQFGRGSGSAGYPGSSKPVKITRRVHPRNRASRRNTSHHPRGADGESRIVYSTNTPP